MFVLISVDVESKSRVRSRLKFVEDGGGTLMGEKLQTKGILFHVIESPVTKSYCGHQTSKSQHVRTEKTQSE